MNRYIKYIPVFLIIFFSCSTSPFNFTYSRAWTAPEGNEFPSMYLGDVLVDKAGGWSSIEREIQDITPLLFSDHGYLFIYDKSRADYIVDIQATEREFMTGWRTKRSVAVEIWIYKNIGIDEYKNTVPIVAGKTTSSGNKSLSSSKDLERLLGAGIKKTIKLLNTAQKIN